MRTGSSRLPLSVGSAADPFLQLLHSLRASPECWVGAEIQHSSPVKPKGDTLFQFCKGTIRAGPGLLPRTPALRNHRAPRHTAGPCPTSGADPALQSPFWLPGLPHPELRLCRANVVLLPLSQSHSVARSDTRRWSQVSDFPGRGWAMGYPAEV